MSSPIEQNEQAIEPAFLRIKAAGEFLGLSAASIYRLIGFGKLRAVKAGGRTLLVMQSLRDYAASLPSAQIRPPPNHHMGLADKPVRKRKRRSKATREAKAEADAIRLQQIENEAA